MIGNYTERAIRQNWITLYLSYSNLLVHSCRCIKEQKAFTLNGWIFVPYTYNVPKGGLPMNILSLR